MRTPRSRLHAQLRALPWWQVPGGAPARAKGHGRAETRTLKAAHVRHLDFPHARQALKITRWRKDTSAGRATRQTVYAITSLTSADTTTRDLARLEPREHWSVGRSGWRCRVVRWAPFQCRRTATFLIWV